MLDALTLLRQTARKLLRTPLFTVTAAVTLAVGIGANTAIFSVVKAVLLEPLPYPEPERLVGIWHTAPGLGFDEVNQAPATHLTYRSDSRLLEDVVMYDRQSYSVTGLDEPEEVSGMAVTEDFFRTLGATPAAGRLFGPEDHAPGTPLRLVLSHGYWQRAFGGDRSVVGRTLTLDGEPGEVVGVAAQSFTAMDQTVEIYTSFRLDPADVFMGNFSYQGFARLAPGATLEAAEEELDRLAYVAPERYPGPIDVENLRSAGFSAVVRPLKDDVVGALSGALWILMGTVGVVLLIACANVANLFLVRAEGRTREVAVRSALGASRGTLARDFLLESVLLGVASGVAGVGLAWLGLKGLLAMAPVQLPRLSEVGIDGEVLLFTLAVSVLAGLVFGLFPVLRHRASKITAALKEGSRGTSVGKDRHRTRNALVVAQVAMALVLLVGSGLMIRSFQALRDVDPGFDDPGSLFTFRVGLPEADIPDEEVMVRFRSMEAELASIPGVRSVGAVSAIPMGGLASMDALLVEGFEPAPGSLPPIRRFDWVLPGYFETMGQELLAGRTIRWDDVEQMAPVVVISRALAREYWGEDPRAALGERVSLAIDEERMWREVVGVVESVHEEGLSEPATAAVYWPAAMTDYWQGEPRIQRSMAWVVRTEPGRMDGLLPQVQDAVWGVTPGVPLASVRTMAEVVDDSLARTSFTLVLLGIAAAVALLLGTVGIYGVISYVVSQRRREIGVRMALGAQKGDVSRMVVGQGMALAGVGVVLGLVVAFGVTRLMESLLYGVEPVDPPTFGAVALLLVAVALVASWIPARRAAGLDPASTLRQE